MWNKYLKYLGYFRKEITMSEIQLTGSNIPREVMKQEPAETAGTIASASNTPSPLFNAVPSVSSETAGTIASSNTSSSSSGGSTSFVC